MEKVENNEEPKVENLKDYQVENEKIMDKRNKIAKIALGIGLVAICVVVVGLIVSKEETENSEETDNSEETETE